MEKIYVKNNIKRAKELKFVNNIRKLEPKNIIHE